MSSIVGPADVVTPVVLFLKSHGFQASATVPDNKPYGTVRVSRTGGGPENQVQDVAELLIELWELDTNRAWASAIRAWQLFAEVAPDQHDAMPPLTIYEVIPSVPLQYQDPYTEGLIRFQFTLSVRYRMVELDPILPPAPEPDPPAPDPEPES